MRVSRGTVKTRNLKGAQLKCESGEGETEIISAAVIENRRR